MPTPSHRWPRCAAAADRRLSLVADVQGLVPRATPSGRISLAIGPVAHGLAAAPDPLPPARIPEDRRPTSRRPISKARSAPPFA